MAARSGRAVAVTLVRGRVQPVAMMGGGLVLVALAGYVFLGLTGHALSTRDAAAVATFYLAMSIVGPGVFAALEQETSRATSACLAAGGEQRSVLARAAVVAGGLLALVLGGLAAVSPVLTGRVLAARWDLFAALLLGAAGCAAAYLVRGLLGGQQRFAGYSVTLATEGLARILPCAVLLLAGSDNATAYALVFASGIGIAAVAGVPWLRAAGGPPAAARPVPDRAGATVSTMAHGLGLLVGATLGFQTVANLAPILVTARISGNPATAAAFSSAFVMVRVPVLLFAAVQAMLLPALTRAATAGEFDVVRRALRGLTVVLAGIGTPVIAAAVIAGPWAVRLLFGAKVALPHTLLGLLALSTVLLMATQALLPALVALDRHRSVTLAWTAGAAVVVAGTSLPVDPVSAGTWAQLAACALVALMMLRSLSVALARRSTLGKDQR